LKEREKESDLLSCCDSDDAEGKKSVCPRYDFLEENDPRTKEEEEKKEDPNNNNKKSWILRCGITFYPAGLSGIDFKIVSFVLWMSPLVKKQIRERLRREASDTIVQGYSIPEGGWRGTCSLSPSVVHIYSTFNGIKKWIDMLSLEK